MAIDPCFRARACLRIGFGVAKIRLVRYCGLDSVKRFALFLVCTNISALVALGAPQGFETEAIRLYEPTDVLEERLPDPPKLTEYIKRLQDVCKRFFAATTSPETLDIVVAIRPGKRSRIWFVSSVQSGDNTSRKSLRKSLEDVTPCSVINGSIAFAIAAKIAGGDGKKREDIPMPLEWQKAAASKRNVTIPDGILDVVWPRR
jgi:hypothetical protein